MTRNKSASFRRACWGQRAITQAASAAEARAHLQRRDFALALIDINLPGESGLELAAGILGERRDVAALMVSGIDDLSVARQALEIGAYGYLVKPFAPNDLVIQVEAALLRRKQLLKSCALAGPALV